MQGLSESQTDHENCKLYYPGDEHVYSLFINRHPQGDDLFTNNNNILLLIYRYFCIILTWIWRDK